MVGELLAQASVGASPQPAQQMHWPTEWDPLALRSARVANAAELVAQGCVAVCSGFLKVALWVSYGFGPA